METLNILNFSGDSQPLAALSAGGNKGCGKSLFLQVLQGEIRIDGCIVIYLHTPLDYIVYILLDGGMRQTELGYGYGQHSAAYGESLKNSDRVAGLRQKIRAGKPGRPGPPHGTF